MVATRKTKIFIHSDERMNEKVLNQLLRDYQNAEIHYIPEDINYFDLLKFEPDVVVVDKHAPKIVKCREWAII